MDCLVTKLKGLVNDSSLLKLGELRVEKTKVGGEWNGANQAIGILAEKGLNLTIIGDGAYFTDKTGAKNKGQSLTLNEYYNEVYVNDTDCEISMDDKYKLKVIYTSPNISGYTATIQGQQSKKILNGLNSLQFCNNLLEIDIVGSLTEGDISSISELDKLTKLRIANTNIYGEIIKISSLLENIDITSTKITGDISVFNSCTVLQELRVQGSGITGNIKSLSAPVTLIAVGNTNIIGNLEDFVATQRSHGRTTGTLSNGGWWGDHIKFNNASPEANSISWTESQITCGDTTIEA